MSVEAMSHVWKSFQGDPTAKLVLLSLADQANNDGWCWPSQAHTATRCMISDRQLRNWLVKLSAEGFIEIHKRPGKSDLYRVVTPEAHFHPPRKPASTHPGSPLPTNHKEPSENPNTSNTVLQRCPYCSSAVRGKSHYCSAMHMTMKGS